MEDKQHIIMDELAGKYFSGELTEAERTRLMQWVDSCADHKAHFEQLRNIWHVSAPAFAPEEIDVERALRNVMRRTEKRGTKGRRLMLWWQRTAAVLFLPVLLGAGYLWYTHRPASIDSGKTYQEISSPFGLCSKVELPDGSTVWLNSGSRLRYPVSFSGKRRDLQLSGEAFFHVHSDREHPFVVNTKDMVITATGTQFNVEAYATDTVTSVTLLEGTLDVSVNRMRSVRLLPDQRIDYNYLSASYNVAETDAARRCLWKDGILAFRGEPLSEVFKRIGRIFNVNIVMKDEDISRQPYRATFQDESFGEILNLLRLTVPIKYKWKKRIRFDDGTFSENEVEVLRED
jgi:ferric-dicitrate binding protein FerR (iron transport regulator)